MAPPSAVDPTCPADRNGAKGQLATARGEMQAVGLAGPFDPDYPASSDGMKGALTAIKAELVAAGAAGAASIDPDYPASADGLMGQLTLVRDAISDRQSATQPQPQAQRLVPNAAFTALTNLSGAYTDVDDDPDSPDAAWLIAGTNGSGTVVEAPLSDPTGSPGTLDTAAGAHEVRVQVRKDSKRTTGNGTPAVTVGIYEGTTLRATPISAVEVGAIEVNAQVMVTL